MEGDGSEGFADLQEAYDFEGGGRVVARVILEEI